MVRAANLFGVGCDIKEHKFDQNGKNNNRNSFNRSNGNWNKGSNSSSNHNPNPPAHNFKTTAQKDAGVKSGASLVQPLNFEAPKLRSVIRQLFRELNIKEDAVPVVKIIQEELGSPTLDKCSDTHKLLKLKSRIEKKKAEASALASSSVPPIQMPPMPLEIIKTS